MNLDDLSRFAQIDAHDFLAGLTACRTNSSKPGSAAAICRYPPGVDFHGW
jgi:hypothetical protein